jgi:hypothetical protein
MTRFNKKAFAAVRHISMIAGTLKRIFRCPDEKTVAAEPRRNGSALCFVLIVLLVMTILGLGMLTAAYGVRHQSLVVRNEMIPKYFAEAGYEQAIFKMKQVILPYQLAQINTGNISFAGGGSCDYSVSWVPPDAYIITSNGHNGNFSHTLSVTVQQNSGNAFEIGACLAPSGATSTTPVYFASGETIDMPIHIDSYGAPDDSTRDIYITGNPTFTQKVSMGESRYSASGSDKYADVMNLFTDGIYFDQPDSKITDQDTLNKKLNYFKDTLQQLNPGMILTPSANSKVTDALPAVQLEFYTGTDGKGYVQMTNNCTVRGYKNPDSGDTWDYSIVPTGNGSSYQQYDTYGYHYIPSDA